MKKPSPIEGRAVLKLLRRSSYTSAAVIMDIW